MEENKEVLTEEIQEETTEVYEPDYEDIVPADDDEPRGSNNGVIGFVGGMLFTGGIALGVKLWNKHQEKKKAKEGSGRYEWKEESEDDEVFEEDATVEPEKVEEKSGKNEKKK